MALIVFLGFVVLTFEAGAQTTTPPLTPPNAAVSPSTSQIIDVDSLSNIVDLDGPWRFHGGDDPHFADPAFDDSSWPSIRPDQPLQTIGISSLPPGYVWTRIHLRLPAAPRHVGLAVSTRGPDQYQVFVNGLAIASSPGMATRTLRNGSPFPVALSATGDVVLAIRFYQDRVPYQFLSFSRVRLGPLAAIRTATEFERLLAFNGGFLANYICIGISLLIGTTGVILYRSQRDHDEYLWLGIYSFQCVAFYVVDTAIYSGRLPDTLSAILLLNSCGWLSIVIGIEFVVRFTRIRRRWPIRILQAWILLGPLLAISPSTAGLHTLYLVFVFVIMFAVSLVCLVFAYRRGMADAGLLLLPCMAWAALDIAWAASFYFPAFGWANTYRLGAVGIVGDYLANIVFDLGIFAIVVYRFLRVTRDEARAAAELEAARTVQQILVPEEIPTIPGFAIEAVYHPAGQVGGDFYQVLPTPNGCLLAIIGDVSGKGMPAAMTVSLLVGTLRTLADYTQDPAEILAAMNQRMIGRNDGGFTTALVLRLDLDGAVTAANAGHMAPYANGKELAVDSGLPLGVIAAAEYKNSTLHVEPGTTITLLTDGVVEAQNAKGELFGFERAAEISGQPAHAVAGAAQSFGQEDDITVLSLALVPSE